MARRARRLRDHDRQSKTDRLRVKPGNAALSLFIDKIRNRNGVATQMPLGAEALEEAEIRELEGWIDAGALREPGAAAAVTMNNPPKRPQIGIFNASGTRLDGTGPVTVAPNTTITLRHTVHDFETADSAIPFDHIDPADDLVDDLSIRIDYEDDDGDLGGGSRSHPS